MIWFLLISIIAILFIFFLTRKNDNVGRSSMSARLQCNIGSGFLLPGQHETFEFLFQGGYYYYVSLFPSLSINSETATKIRNEFHLIIYDPNDGQRLADDSGNGAPLCRMLITEGEPMNLKVVVLRDTQTTNSNNKLVDYQVTLFGYDSKTYDKIGQSVVTIPFPEVYWSLYK